MQLKEMMTRDVHTVDANATVRNAAEQMASLDVGVLPVTEDGKAVGMITDRDITIRAVAKGLDPDKSSVRDTMTAEIEAASGETSLEDAAELMKSRQIRRLAVTDQNGRLQGIVSLGDLATRCEDKAVTAETLQAVSQ